MLRKLICIQCPKGCTLEVEMDTDTHVTHVQGNSCPKGKEYAIREVLCPMRLVTGTVRIKNGSQRMLPVRSREEIPLEKMIQAMEPIHACSVQAPVQCGQVIVEDLAGTGIPLIAARSMKKNQDCS